MGIFRGAGSEEPEDSHESRWQRRNKKNGVIIKYRRRFRGARGPGIKVAEGLFFFRRSVCFCSLAVHLW